MDKLLDNKQSAEKYWIKQLKDNNEQFVQAYNLTIYEYADERNIIHLYPDNTCKLCNLIQKAIDDYCSAKTYKEQLEIINKLDIYRINNGKKITGTLLLKIRDINKAIQNFIDKTMNCEICEIINKLCEKYYNETDEIKKKELITQIEKFEMNGYELLKYKEKNGYDLENINQLNHYLVECHDLNHYNNMKYIDNKVNDSISLNRSHWCKTCGARKPDIICTNL